MGHWPLIVVSRFLGVTSGSPCHAPRLVATRSGHSAWYLVVTWHSRWDCESSFWLEVHSTPFQSSAFCNIFLASFIQCINEREPCRIGTSHTWSGSAALIIWTLLSNQLFSVDAFSYSFSPTLFMSNMQRFLTYWEYGHSLHIEHCNLTTQSTVAVLHDEVWHVEFIRFIPTELFLFLATV